MIKGKHLALVLAGIDGDVSEVLGWICAAAWMAKSGKRGRP